nr:UvrD-helicase domain-containing protein [Candidatus Dadabacteria bacterium]
MERISKLLSLNSEQKKLLNIGKPYVVEASAGSGKTRVLVSRYLQILESGRADVNGIVAITFTLN